MTTTGSPRDRAPLSPLGTARNRVQPRDRMDGGTSDLLAELQDVDRGEEWLYLAWQLAAWARGMDAADRRKLTPLLVRSIVAVAQGSTRLAIDVADRALLLRAPEVVGGPGTRLPLIVDQAPDGSSGGAFLYHQRMLACETRVADAVVTRVQAGSATLGPALDQAVGEVIADAVPPPTAEQEAAIRGALRSRLAVVTGGPGTGKTTIALGIVRALVRIGVPVEAIALAAPTGKAANRLEETIKAGLSRLSGGSAVDHRIAEQARPAQTLHRLLGYTQATGRFQHHRNNRLSVRAVIVDEGSMIDLVLMERLLDALPDDAQLVLLGDPDQLPSVAAGAVFRDLEPLALRLTASHRMDPRDPAGRRVLQVAQAVRDGRTEALAELIDDRASPAELSFVGVERVDAGGREGLLERWFEERVALPAELDDLARVPVRMDGAALDDRSVAGLERLLNHSLSARVLAVTRGRDTGVDATNAWFHARWAPSPGLQPGEPVLMLRNDYERGLFNGDQGVIARFEDRAGRVTTRAAFPTRSGWAAWDLASFGDGLALAYALTVHKAQGSELDSAALLLPSAPMPLLTRELLYTAVTRSRRSVVICGDAAVLQAAVGEPLRRSSGLRDRVASR